MVRVSNSGSIPEGEDRLERGIRLFSKAISFVRFAVLIAGGVGMIYLICVSY